MNTVESMTGPEVHDAPGRVGSAVKSILPCLISLATALVLVGCVATPRQFAPFPDQTKAVEDPGKGRIYVLRPEWIADEIPMKVYDNGELVGQTGTRSYLCWERDPGQTVIVGEVAPVYEGPTTQSKVELTVEPGHAHYIIQHIRIPIGDIITFKNWNPLNKLEVVDEVKGKKTLNKCKPPK